MDQNSLTIFNLARQRMGYLGERQAVLSHNVANADTPGYKSRDLTKMDFKSVLDRTSSGNVSLAMTNTKHMRPAGAETFGYKVREDQNTFETSPDGNSVQIDEQILKINETAADYQMTVGMYRKMSEMLRLALGGNGS